MARRELKLFNTLSQKKEVFQPRLNDGKVRIYGCGPTVYGYIHVGNGRAALTMDLLLRVLKLAGYEPLMARNYTDVDDKIIKVANDNGEDSSVVSERFIRAYDADMEGLGVPHPQYRPKATESMPAIIKMIEGLIAKGLAYPAETPFGSDVYFRVEKFKDYGCLSKRKTDDLIQGARIEPGESKESALDFALWKAAKPGEPSWESPWGGGRPGWHIECSAMIESIFGREGVDIHMGGLDLIFPHHENEIAQSEGLHECRLANYWVHNGMLEFGKVKMSKSLGNIVTMQSFLQSYGGELYRLMALQQHYRSPMDFSQEAICRSEGLLERLYHCKAKAQQVATLPLETVLPQDLAGLRVSCEEALLDDLNSAKALGFVLKAARFCFKEDKPAYWRAWGEALPVLESIFGILHEEPAKAHAAVRQRRLQRWGLSDTRAKEIEAKVQAREQVRAAKDFAESDRLRDALAAEGILVMDGPDGSSWTLDRPLEA